MLEDKRKVKGHKPEVALLALNKQIRDEALPVLFGKNIWRITANEVDLAEDHASRLDNDMVDTLWHRYGSHIQKVDLKYTHTIYPPETLKDTIEYAHRVSPGHRSDRAMNIHANARIDLEICWVAIGDAMSWCPNIKSLNTDIGDLYCPVGCCRTNIVRRLFHRPGYTAAVNPEVGVSVSGIFDKKEKQSVIEWRTRSGSGKDKEKAIAHTQITMYDFDS